MEKEWRRQIMAELPIWQYDTLFLIVVVLFGVTALTMQNLMSAAIVFGAYSFLMCLIWTAMGAVDVAFTEAAVGAGVSTVFIVATIYNTGASAKPRKPRVGFKLFAGAVAVATGAFLLSALPDFPAWGDPQSPVNSTVAPYYIENTIRDAHVPNIVTTVLADYRGFDTLLETAVVFIACIAIYSILRVDSAKSTVDEPDIIAAPPAYDPTDSLIIRQASRIMVPFMQIFALYVIAHGHYSPGGGFQGGVILGASVILLCISFDLKFVLRQWTEKKIMLLTALGVLIYAAVGVACIFMGGDYLNYNALDPVLPGDMAYARYYGILLVEIGVGVTVMFSMIGIYIILASNGRFKRGL
ncbi:MAG TPA: sodium:proton antiporter [Verrucomicrobiales bacterium]|nr:sodium:proton antiporter [Verrucomicrobiales bacterium]